MLTIYLFFMTVKVACTLACAIVAWKIAHKSVTPTSTYMLFFWGFVMALASQVIALFNAGGIAMFLLSFNKWLVVGSQIIAALVFALFLMALIRKLAALKVMGIE